MKLGIIQGRLSKPTLNHIQQFPNNWEHEFELLKTVGLDFIEWLVTAECFSYVLKLNAKPYSNYITSIGCDNLTNKNIGSVWFLEEQLGPICEFAVKNNIKSITIPLLETSRIDSFSDKFIETINNFSNKYKSLNFNFELESPYQVAIDLCSSNDNFYLTYDTGNITACKLDHEEYISHCISFINTVHLKDKTTEPIANVEPGTGNTDFDLIFKVLKSHNYNGNFTLQTSRGPTGDELPTVGRHIDFFKRKYNNEYNTAI